MSGQASSTQADLGSFRKHPPDSSFALLVLAAILVACTSEQEAGRNAYSWSSDDYDTSADQETIDPSLLSDDDDDDDGYSEDDGDCNDQDPNVHPDAVEKCDDIDHDCDGLARNDLLIEYSGWYEDPGYNPFDFDNTDYQYSSLWAEFDRGNEDSYSGSGGRLLIYKEDGDLDGHFEYRFEFTYDADGNWLTYERDDNADGVIEYRVESTYDVGGNQLTYDRDENADGIIDYHEEYTRDASGNLLTYSLDENADGTLDYYSEYTYDAAGNWLTYERDEGADGTVDYRSESTYDVDGNRVNYAQDALGDGSVDGTYEANCVGQKDDDVIDTF